MNHSADTTNGFPFGNSQISVEYFVASDGTAIVEHTKNVMFLEDNDIVHFSDGSFAFYSIDCLEDVKRELQILEVELNQIDKGQFGHFMLKEIFEQVSSVNETMRGRIDFSKETVKLGGIQSQIANIKKSNRIVFIACGTSYHSTVATRALVEEFGGIPVTLELASDFLDRCPPVFRNDTCVFISQSGETADTLRALEYCKKHQALCVGITNTVGSAISRLTDCGIYLNCGPEIGVASTKAYTSQIVALVLFALQLGDNVLSLQERRKEIIRSLKCLSDVIRKTLILDGEINEIARKISENKSLLILGRGYQFATCLEGALKVKEISYMHCEGVMSGELKHGPLALIDHSMPMVFIATRDRLFEKVKSGFEQVIARKGQPIVICNAEEVDSIPPQFIKIIVPRVDECLQAIVNIIPLQLLSYHLAVSRGFNVDKPRNLAKSVTVE